MNGLSDYENQPDEPTGWAIAIDGKISIRTASYREEAAMLNALVLFGGVDPLQTRGASDEAIRSAYRGLALASSPARKLEVVRVVCVLAEGGEG
jgi:hypothetical protein